MTNQDQRPRPRKIQWPLRREEVDLPKGAVAQTFHHASSKKTITEIRLSDGLPIHNLYWRPTGGARYAAVHPLNKGQSLENAVNCDAAWIFARLQVWAATAGGYGSRTNEIVRIDMTSVPRLESLLLTDILPERAKVHRLLRADDSGTRLQAVVLFLEPYDDGRAHRSRYAICVIDLASRLITELDTLAGIEY